MTSLLLNATWVVNLHTLPISYRFARRAADFKASIGEISPFHSQCRRQGFECNRLSSAVNVDGIANGVALEYWSREEFCLQT